MRIQYRPNLDQLDFQFLKEQKHYFRCIIFTLSRRHFYVKHFITCPLLMSINGRGERIDRGILRVTAWCMIVVMPQIRQGGRCVWQRGYWRWADVRRYLSWEIVVIISIRFSHTVQSRATSRCVKLSTTDDRETVNSKREYI